MKTLIDNTAVRIESEKDQKELLRILHDDGRQWSGGSSLLRDDIISDIFIIVFCINIGSNGMNNGVMHGSEAYYKEIKYNVISLQEFKERIRTIKIEVEEETHSIGDKFIQDDEIYILSLIDKIRERIGLINNKTGILYGTKGGITKNIYNITNEELNNTMIVSWKNFFTKIKEEENDSKPEEK